jgi:hypothetical protein
MCGRAHAKDHAHAGAAAGLCAHRCPAKGEIDRRVQPLHPALDDLVSLECQSKRRDFKFRLAKCTPSPEILRPFAALASFADGSAADALRAFTLPGRHADIRLLSWMTPRRSMIVAPSARRPRHILPAGRTGDRDGDDL